MRVGAAVLWAGILTAGCGQPSPSGGEPNKGGASNPESVKPTPRGEDTKRPTAPTSNVPPAPPVTPPAIDAPLPPLPKDAPVSTPKAVDGPKPPEVPVPASPKPPADSAPAKKP